MIWLGEKRIRRVSFGQRIAKGGAAHALLLLLLLLLRRAKVGVPYVRPTLEVDAVRKHRTNGSHDARRPQLERPNQSIEIDNGAG